MGLGGILDLLRLRGWLGSETDVCLAALPLQNEPGRCMGEMHIGTNNAHKFRMYAPLQSVELLLPCT